MSVVPVGELLQGLQVLDRQLPGGPALGVGLGGLPLRRLASCGCRGLARPLSKRPAAGTTVHS